MSTSNVPDKDTGAQPLLPPRGILIPTRLIFGSHLPPAVLFTWIQLRALAWNGGVTPAMTLKEISTLTGRSQRLLRKHIVQLSSSDAITCQVIGPGKMTISFPPQVTRRPDSQPAGCPSPMLANQAAATDSASYFPRRILRYITYENDLEPIIKDSVSKLD